MLASLKQGLQGRFPHHQSNRWSERGGSLFKSPIGSCSQEWQQLLSMLSCWGWGRAEAVSQIATLWGCLLFPHLMRWTKVLNLGSISELCIGEWEGAGLHPLESPLNIHDLVGQIRIVSLFCPAFSLITCHSHSSLTKYFVRVHNKLGQDSIVSLEANK